MRHRAAQGWVELSSIAMIEDAAARAKAAHDVLRALETSRSEVVRLRRDAVSELRAQGWTWRAVATLLGIHRNRAAHLLDGLSVSTPP
ncbi:MAG: hypothetical protein M0Z46_18555 [Actinomycetota bacterium]|jgi:hypothetical protein|nr:hypothetical protein [Actinomycetota bacterium]